MRKTLAVGEMAARDLLRRRGVLALLALMPLAFYLARRDTTGLAIRFVSLGLAWAVSTAALFSGNAAKDVERRLRLAGYRASHLYLGRFCAVLAIGFVLALGYFVVIVLDQDVHRPAAIALQMALTVAIAGPLGMLISAVAPRDLEGTLLLITLVGLQLIVDPAKSSGKLLPLWSSRELTTYAVDLTGSDYLLRGLVHGLCFAVGLAATTAALTVIRLRRRRHVMQMRPTYGQRDR